MDLSDEDEDVEEVRDVAGSSTDTPIILFTDTCGSDSTRPPLTVTTTVELLKLPALMVDEDTPVVGGCKNEAEVILHATLALRLLLVSAFLLFRKETSTPPFINYEHKSKVLLLLLMLGWQLPRFNFD